MAKTGSPLSCNNSLANSCTCSSIMSYQQNHYESHLTRYIHGLVNGPLSSWTLCTIWYWLILVNFLSDFLFLMTAGFVVGCSGHQLPAQCFEQLKKRSCHVCNISWCRAVLLFSWKIDMSFEIVCQRCVGLQCCVCQSEYSSWHYGAIKNKEIVDT